MNKYNVSSCLLRSVTAMRFNCSDSVSLPCVMVMMRFVQIVFIEATRLTRVSLVQYLNASVLVYVCVTLIHHVSLHYSCGIQLLSNSHTTPLLRPFN